jgi:hypothetical protein
MVGIHAENILDLVKAQYKHLGAGKFNEIATDIRQFEAFSRLLRKDRVEFDGGTGIQRQLMMDDLGTARDVALFETDDVSFRDVMVQIDIPWRHTEVSYIYDVKEMLMNVGSGGAPKLFDVVKSREAAATLSLAEHCETRFWSKPVDSTTATEIKKVFGVFYWLVYNASEGFNGGNASGFTSGPGNLSATSNPRWKNYTAQYTTVSKVDLIDKMKRAAAKTRFKSVVDLPDYRSGKGDRYRIYCNLDTRLAFENVGEAQNENLGRDLYRYDNAITFQGNPIREVASWDDSGTTAIASGSDPVLMLDFNYFHPVFLRGDYMRRTGPRFMGNSHDVMAVWKNLTWNLLCTDRRRQTLIAKSDPMA